MGEPKVLIGKTYRICLAIMDSRVRVIEVRRGQGPLPYLKIYQPSLYGSVLKHRDGVSQLTTRQ